MAFQAVNAPEAPTPLATPSGEMGRIGDEAYGATRMVPEVIPEEDPEDYGLVHLSRIDQWNGDHILEVLEKVGAFRQVPCMAELPDETWEILVLDSFRTELHAKLNHHLPGCLLDLDYSWDEPTPAAVQQLGYPLARYSFVRHFSSRAYTIMDSAWPIAVACYHAMLEKVLGA